MDLGLIEGGHEKSATSLGTSLGRALDHGKEDQIQRFWRQAVKQSETLTGILTDIRIAGGSSEEELSSDVLYKAELKATARNKRGAKTVVEIIKKSGLVEESDGVLVLSSKTPEAGGDDEVTTIEEEVDQETNGDADFIQAPAGRPTQADPIVQTVYKTNGGPTIAINIQLELPPATDPVVYDNLFRSLAEHLLPNQERQAGDDD